jgi:glycosyltransferase involved in cell wall biosynthesis
VRILIALNYYYPHISGLSESVRLLAEGLAQRNCSVTVLVGQHDPSLPRDELRNGVRIVRASVLFKLHKGYISPDLILTFRRLRADADIVHIVTPMPEAGLLAAMSGKRPLIVTHVCDIVPQNRGSFLASLIERPAFRLVRMSARAALRRAKWISVSSGDYASGSPELRGLLDRCVSIPHPDNAPLDPVQPKAQGLRVGFLGRFVAEKGIGVLLDAVPLVLREIPDARFILAGNHSSVAGGSLFESLKPQLDRLRDAVEVPGIIPAEKLGAFYRSLDVFVLPSTDSFESFGIVQLEAMKAGVPVIATDMRGVRVPIQATGNGIVVPPGDAKALAQAIVDVLKSRRFDPQTVSQSAWRVFPKDLTVDRTLALYRNLMERRAA